MKLSEVIESPEDFIDKNTYARIEIDLALNYEDANYIKELLEEIYSPEEITLVPGKEDEDHSIDFGGDINFESVDSVVLSHLQSIESVNIHSELLTDIYKSL